MLIKIINNADFTLALKLTRDPHLISECEENLPYLIPKNGTPENSVVIVSNQGNPERNLLMGILDLYKINGNVEDYMKNEGVIKALSERIKKLREIHLIKERS